MTCNSCGFQLPDGSKLCYRCGADPQSPPGFAPPRLWPKSQESEPAPEVVGSVLADLARGQRLMGLWFLGGLLSSALFAVAIFLSPDLAPPWSLFALASLSAVLVCAGGVVLWVRRLAWSLGKPYPLFWVLPVICAWPLGALIAMFILSRQVTAFLVRQGKPVGVFGARTGDS